MLLYIIEPIFNPQRACAAGVKYSSLCVCVCLSVSMLTVTPQIRLEAQHNVP